MQFINEQYKVVGLVREDKYGVTYAVEDIQKGNSLKHLRIINLSNETKEFIEYMKNNFYDYSTYQHANLMELYFFNSIKLIDNKQVLVNQYYYTYDYFKGINILEFSKGKTSKELLDLMVQLCTAVKFLHLRGLLLYGAGIDEVIVSVKNSQSLLKLLALPYPSQCSRRILLGKQSDIFKAPELTQGLDYTTASDVFIIGAIMFYAVSGIEPNEDHDIQELISKYHDNSDNDYGKLMSIIKKCTLPDQRQRYQTTDEIADDINRLFGINISIIDKKYIQRMPEYRVKPAARQKYISRIFNNIKGHFYAERANKVSLVVCGEGSGKRDFLDAINTKAEQEGFIPIHIVLSESDLNRFSILVAIVKSIAKYADKEILDKYSEDLTNVLTPVSLETIGIRDDKRLKLIYKVGSFITEVSQKFHSVFIIDNIQWIDQDSLELIDALLRSKSSSKTYFILAVDKEVYNTSKEIEEYSSKLKELSGLDVVELDNYNLEETEEYVRLILGMDKPPIDFSKKIYEKTGGSPEYIYDIIYTLYSNNDIFVDDRGKWVFENVEFDYINRFNSNDIDTLSNVYRLNSSYKDILEALSIFNIPTPADLIESFVDIEGEELISMLNYLSYINILVREYNDWGVSYSFNSINLKNKIYNSIPEQVRRKYHEKASYILKNKITRENRDNEDELIYQMLKANWHSEVKQYLLYSADEMIAEHKLAQAVQFLEHAYSLFSKNDMNEEKVLVCNKLGELYSYIGEYSKSIFYINIVEGVAEHLKDTKMLIDVYLKKFSLLYKLSDRKTSLKYLTKAKRLLNGFDYKEGLYESIIALNRI